MLLIPARPPVRLAAYFLGVAVVGVCAVSIAGIGRPLEAQASGHFIEATAGIASTHGGPFYRFQPALTEGELVIEGSERFGGTDKELGPLAKELAAVRI